MEISSNNDIIEQIQRAGVSEVTFKFDKDSNKSQSPNLEKKSDSINSADFEIQEEQSQEDISSSSRNEIRFPWQGIYFDALKYNKEVNGENIDSEQHVDDASAEALREILESKIARKSKCEPIYRDLAYLTNYLYDTYDYNYSKTNSERDPQGNYVYNIERAIIVGIKTNYLQINLEETKQIIEAIGEKYGDTNKVDDSNFANVISKIACNSRGKEILEIVLKFMNKFGCIDKPAILKEVVNKIEQIVNKHGDVSVLNELVLAIEENDIGKDILMKKILEQILDLKKDEYERLKKDRVLNNYGNLFEISAEDLQTLITNYNTKKTINAKKVDDYIKEIRNKRRLKNSAKNMGADRSFTRKPIVILGAAGMIAAAFLSVKTLFLNNKSNSLKNTSAEMTIELETEDEELYEDIKPEMPEALQEENKKYYIVQYKDPISKEKELVYLQMDRDEYEIPETDNVIITKDGVIENVDRYELTPVLTEMYLEEGSYIYVLFYNPQDESKAEKYTYFYYDDENNIYTNTIPAKKLSNMEEGDIITEFNDGANKVQLFTLIPTFFTTKEDVSVAEQESNIIPSGTTFLGSKEETVDGEIINAIGIMPKGENDNQSKIRVARIESEEIKKVESSIDKYENEEIQEDVSSGFTEVGEYTLDDNFRKLYVYSSTNTMGIPKYIFGEGVHIILYEYDKDEFNKGFIVADENKHQGQISIEDGEEIKELINQNYEQESSNNTETEEEYEESKYKEENKDTEDTEISSFDAFEEEWDGEEIE